MEQKKTAEMTFDHWSELARTDPEGFEARRREAIEEAIQQADVRNRDRLRRLQWRIDQERRLARTPLAACMRLSAMMWKTVLGRGGLRQRVADLQLAEGGHGGRGRDDAGLAPVLAFARQRD